MEYSDIKTILYQSEEIQLIPDKWGESVPFRCTVDGEEYDAFLYWNPSDRQAELKRMIGVNSNNGTVVVFSAQDLVERFDLQKLVFQIPPIEDYDVYFTDKDRYEELYAELCSSENAYKKIGKEEYLLLSKLVGNDLLSNLFFIIAGNYVNKLQSGD